MAGTYNLNIKRGAAFVRTIKLKDSAGAAINLTGATPVGKLLPKNANVPAIDLTVANGKLTIVGAPANGEVLLRLTDEETSSYAAWSAGRWYFNVEFSNGDIQDYLEGSVALTNLGGG